MPFSGYNTVATPRFSEMCAGFPKKFLDKYMVT